jgi:hypothetical protein
MSAFGGWVLWKALFPPRVTVAEDRPRPRTPEEEAVHRYLVGHADDPDIQFVRWGPHDVDGKLWKVCEKWGHVDVSLFSFFIRSFSMTQTQREQPQPLPTANAAAREAERSCSWVRVCYRDRNRQGAREYHDVVFQLRGKEVVRAIDNPQGDAWIDSFEENIRLSVVFLLAGQLNNVDAAILQYAYAHRDKRFDPRDANGWLIRSRERQGEPVGDPEHFGWPDSLEAVIGQRARMPWGAVMQYDRKGPHHQGKGIDVWVNDPDGRPIGNWPEL